MKDRAYDDLSRAEEAHWYHSGRKDLVNCYLGYACPRPDRKTRILDIGCGTGGMLGTLEKYGSVTALELSDHAADICVRKHHSARVVRGSANDLGTIFKGEKFDVVTILNVLYHEWIEHDIDVLRQAHALLDKGGHILVNEPAYMFLYRDNDRVCLGKRRYTRGSLAALMRQAGFGHIRSTYFNSVSLIPAFALSCLQRIGFMRTEEASDELFMPPAAINASLKSVMSAELALIKTFGSFPFGVSILAIGKKAL